MEHILGHLLHKYELTILILLFKGCEYGDKTECSAVTSRNSCYRNGDACCETCAPYVTNIASKIAYPINRIYLINIHTAKPNHFISTVCKCWCFLAKFWSTLWYCLCINGNGMQFGVRTCMLVPETFVVLLYHFYLICHAFGIKTDILAFTNILH